PRPTIFYTTCGGGPNPAPLWTPPATPAPRAGHTPAEEVALRDLLCWALAHRTGHGRGALPTRELALELTGAIGDRPEEAWAKCHQVANLLRLGVPEALRPDREPAVVVSAR
ncbi:hypothetical protein ACFWX6_22805, partial [Amycolatopsis sp. NPDC059019]